VRVLGFVFFGVAAVGCGRTALESGGIAGVAGQTVPTGGLVNGTGGRLAQTGGATGTGGITSKGSASGTGGITSKGGATGTGGATGLGGLTGIDAAGSGGDCYNVALDFSRSGANPSGRWAYGISNQVGSDLILFSVFSTSLSQASDSSQMAWWSMDGAQAPLAALNPSNVDRHPAGTTTYGPGEFVLHPGSTGQLAIARWTAPSAGTVHVEAVFAGCSGWQSAPVTTTDVYLLLNRRVLVSGYVNVKGASNEFSLSQDVSVATGDPIDFAVGWGNGSYVFDSTALAATLCIK
jgi:hypothetical protein